jgi:uroporphyrinogen-III synthase
VNAPNKQISSLDLDYLLSGFLLPADLKNELEKLKNKKIAAISYDAADRLRDICIDRLDTHGFDENYNATAEGKRLEVLIDKLFTK